MDSRFCMNELCGAPSSSSGEWRKGWALRSGGFATLCDKCGTAYEQLAFCDMFHSGDTGWRDCKSCGKRLHCGCIASVSLLEILDSSGVTCIGCVKSSGLHLPSVGNPKRFGTLLENCVGDTRSSSLDNQINGESNRYMNFKHLASSADDNGPRHLLPPQNEDTTGSHNQMKQEEILPSSGDIGTTCLSNFGITSTGLSQDAKLAVNQANMGVNDACRSPVQTNLTISLAGPSGNPNLFPAAIFKEMELNKAFVSVQQGSTRSQHLLPKAPKPVLGAVLGTNASATSQIRVARQPVEGRVKNQLLPRYWPRITEQELQQISGDSNSTIVPLFEKVLSASDAGRIGRLVLPKACAEAYFPPISHPEGIPLRIQDVKGKEWMFQFRFWPNNNSRMYVLEGVTPCIQSMQLQAGDTVTFSRMDPEGKLLMGFRKASNSILMQDTHLSAKHNGAFASEPFLSGVVDNLPFMSGYSGLLHSMNGSTDPHLKAFSKHLDSSSGDVSWNLAEKNGGRGMGGFLPPTMAAPERKRSRNIGMKSKRLLIDNEDALELKLTWEEAQEMLRPPTSNKPTTVTIEDHEFEEYNEPPVFGKRSIFTVRLSGEQEQWVPCDDCSKWRRLPAEFLLPPSWRCQDNVWDHSRCSCSAPDELSPRELEYLLKLNNDFKKRRIAATQEHESATPYAAMAHNTIQGDTSNPGSISVATTTKHPRHRPGCSCIVCIQPPSGKGKHKPTCTCNVCMTVKRRFKTLMMRKKKRQSEREAEIAQRNQFIWGGSKEEMTEAEMDSSTYRQVTSSQADLLENEVRLGSELQIMDQSNNGSQKVNETTNNEELDLNSHPQRSGEDLPIGSTRVSMMSLLEVANRPLETYLKQNGLTSLISGQQQAASSGGSHVQAQFHTLPQATAQSEGQPHEDQALAPVDQEQEKGGDDKLGEPDQIEKDPS